jgi:hypothetical protein
MLYIFVLEAGARQEILLVYLLELLMKKVAQTFTSEDLSHLNLIYWFFYLTITICLVMRYPS